MLGCDDGPAVNDDTVTVTDELTSTLADDDGELRECRGDAECLSVDIVLTNYITSQLVT